YPLMPRVSQFRGSPLSINSVLWRYRALQIPAVRPAGPPPTIATSYSPSKSPDAFGMHQARGKILTAGRVGCLRRPVDLERSRGDRIQRLNRRDVDRCQLTDANPGGHDRAGVRGVIQPEQMADFVKRH